MERPVLARPHALEQRTGVLRAGRLRGGRRPAPPEGGEAATGRAGVHLRDDYLPGKVRADVRLVGDAREVPEGEGLLARLLAAAGDEAVAAGDRHPGDPRA